MKRLSLPLFFLTLLLAGCGGIAEGPLAFPPSAGESWVSLGVRPNEVGVVGIPLEYRTRSAQAVLLAVYPTDPAQVGTARLRASASNGLGIGSAHGWDPTAWGLRPVRGFPVKQDGTTRVIVGVAATKGTIFIHSFTVDYRVGRTHYRTAYPVGIKICVGTSLSCP